MINPIILLITLSTLLFSAPIFEYSGNDNISAQELTDASGIPDEFVNIANNRKAYVLAQASNNLSNLYYSRGYFSVEITPSRYRQDDDEYIKFTITEGSQYFFGEVKIDQPTWTSYNYPESDLSISKGSEFNPDEIQENQENIRKHYQNQGYLHTQISQDISIDTLEYFVNISYVVKPQRRVYLDKVKVKIGKGKSYLGEASGKGLSDSAHIADLWPLENGEVITVDELTTMRAKLLSTGVFNRVSIKDSLPDENSIQSTLVIDLKERVPGSWGGSAFYEELIGFGGLVNFKYLNVGGEFHQLSAEALAAQRRQRISLGYTQPILFGSRVRFEDKVIVNRESLPLPENPDSLENRIEIINRGKLSYPLNSLIRLSALTDLRYVDINASQVRFKWEPSISFNWTNDRVEPTRGIKSTFNFGQGGPFDAQDRHWYHEWVNRFYLPVSKTTTWAVAIDHGKTYQTANLDDARLFYQGGFRSVRGYPSRSIFPYQGEGESLLTGTAPEYWRASNEFRFNLPPLGIGNIQLVQFTDWTLISDLNKEFKSKNRSAVGMGLRYKLSLLTVRLDYTFKKDIDDPFGMEPFSWGRFSFDLSQAI